MTDNASTMSTSGDTEVAGTLAIVAPGAPYAVNFSTLPSENPESAIGIGGVVTHAPLPHHRTCGSRIRRFGGLSRALWKDGRVPASRNGHWGARLGQLESAQGAKDRESWQPLSRLLPNSHLA